MNSTPWHEYLDPCCDIAQAAGERIMAHFGRVGAVQHKTDGSPVTEADIVANALIVGALKTLAPHIPVIAEEDNVPPDAAPELFWLVDPLDGTRAFVAGEAEFTVNIALIRQGQPVLGVIYAPPQDRLYFAARGQGAFCLHKGAGAQKIEARPAPGDGLVVTKSKSHFLKKTQAYLDSLRIKEIRASSSSIKLCHVAEGSADLYPRFGNTMEWDTAAGHAIVNEAGGSVENLNGETLRYGKPGFKNHGFIAFGKR